MVKFQSELTRARIELSKSSNGNVLENHMMVGEVLYSRRAFVHSPFSAKVQETVRGGSAIIASPSRALDSSIPRLDITIKTAKNTSMLLMLT